MQYKHDIMEVQIIIQTSFSKRCVLTWDAPATSRAVLNWAAKRSAVPNPTPGRLWKNGKARSEMNANR